MGPNDLALAALILCAAALYASVGHGGASGYLAAMALFGIAPAVMKPTALALNILVSGIALAKYARRGAFAWPLFWPLALTAIPLAYLGGRIDLPAHLYKPLVGAVLVYAAWRSWLTAAGADRIELRAASRAALFGLGAALGLLSGLTGVGGGIFLSPLLLFLRWADVRTISGVAAAFILVNSCAGLAGVMSRAPQLPAALPWWALAAVIGGWVGAEYGSKHLRRPTLQRLLAVVLLVAGAKMLLG